MTKRSQLIVVGLAVVVVASALIVVSGCTGPSNHPPTVHVISGGTGTIWGYVIDDGENPIPGVLVTVSDGQRLYSGTTDLNGFYEITNVPLGARVVSFGASGYVTIHEATTLTPSMPTAQVDATLDTTGTACPDNRPTITVEDTTVDQDVGSVLVEGTTSNTSGIDTAVAVLNGQEQIIELYGDFAALLFLNLGQNTIVIRASNCQGDTLSDPIIVNFTGEFVFRVTLTWDRLTDIDLHTWAPGLSGGVQHCAYWDMDIDAGDLDVDNTVGFGPENFTARTLIPGRYAIGVNFYSFEDFSGPTGCTVRVLAPGQSPVNFGPHTLTTPNFEGGYPVTVDTASWWRPCDIIVAANGSVTVVAPDTSIAYEEASTSSLGLSLPVADPRTK